MNTTRTSHATCTHPVTAAGRRACRAARAAVPAAAPAIAPVATGLIMGTRHGNVRVGSVILLDGDFHTILTISRDVKNGRSGWVAAERWGYAHQVDRIISY